MSDVVGGGSEPGAALTFNRRVIFVNEVALDQLNRQARLSDTTTTDNHQLVFSEELFDREKRRISIGWN